MLSLRLSPDKLRRASTCDQPGDQLGVRDFGRGLPEGSDLKDVQSSLGMKVVAALARQLKGALRIEKPAPEPAFC